MCRSSRFRSGWGTAISVPRRTSTRIWMRKAKAARRTPCCAVWASPPRRIRAHKGKGQATHVTWPNVGGVGGIRTHGPGRANRFRVFYRTWNLPEIRRCSRKLSEAKNAGKSGVFRQAEAILRSGRRGSKKITVLSDFGENFAFWRENRREKRENAPPENASAVGQN